MSKKTGKKKLLPLVKGVLDITRSGIGYVIAEGREDIVRLKIPCSLISLRRLMRHQLWNQLWSS